jgi:hypothetical protein
LQILFKNGIYEKKYAAQEKPSSNAFLLCKKEEYKNLQSLKAEYKIQLCLKEEYKSCADLKIHFLR